jgi:acetyl-CoA carboxylase biotin carboxylase subunit
MPSPGRITALRAPGGPWVRDDSGVYEGAAVPIHYDPLISKLVVWGADRTQAISRMSRALAEYKVVGVRTTIPILQQVMAHPDFATGRLSTHFLETVALAERPEGEGRHRAVALIAAALAAYARAGKATLPLSSSRLSPWKMSTRPGWSRPR